MPFILDQTIIFALFCFFMAGDCEPRAFHILGKPFSTTELHSQPKSSRLHIYYKRKAFVG